MDKINEFLDFELLNVHGYTLSVSKVFAVLVIIIIARLVMWLIKKALFRAHKAEKRDSGNTYALYQIIKYFIWVIAIGFILEAIGIKVTLLLAGSAALLVGIGLGLQQTFNDFISGIILLSERSIKINDILEIDGDIVKIQEIGLRTSKGMNRDGIFIIIPNSLITTNKVINWSHQSKNTRFRIDVSVAYGSDVDKVLRVLEESVKTHPDLKDREAVEARFLDFGDSSLKFQVLFYSESVFRIEKFRSDIRKIINRKFIENDITIPFPQMDLHLKTDNTKKKERS